MPNTDEALKDDREWKILDEDVDRLEKSIHNQLQIVDGYGSSVLKCWKTQHAKY